MRAGPGLPKSATEETKPPKPRRRLRKGKPPPDLTNRCPESLIITDGWVPKGEQSFRWEAQCQLEIGHLGYHRYGKIKWSMDRTSSYMDLLVQDLTGIRSAGGIRSQLAIMSRISQQLTAREIEIVKMMAEGHENKIIAADLDISEQTVKNHVTSILEKLNVGNRTQAALKAVQMGLVPGSLANESTEGEGSAGSI